VRQIDNENLILLAGTQTGTVSELTPFLNQTYKERTKSIGTAIEGKTGNHKADEIQWAQEIENASPERRRQGYVF